MLRVSAGSKVFYVRRKYRGKSERIHIGRFPDVSVEEARKKAAKILSEIADGKHPQHAARVIAAEPTIEELFKNDMEGHVRQRCSRSRDMEKDFNRYASDCRYKPYSLIRRGDVQNKINRVLEINGPGAANHMIILMRSMMNWNLRNEKIPAGKHLVEPKRPWFKLLEDAQIENFRLHDLRRTLASCKAMGNHSLPVIAKALGHKTIAATQIYSRLMSDPVRDAMEDAQSNIHLLGELKIDAGQK